MVVSIVLTGKYNIGINSNNKIKVNDKLISVSDIPFIRYRFNSYGDSEIEFIKKNKAKFKEPVHMAEVILGDDTADVLSRLEEIENLATFLYVPVDDTDIANGLKPETARQLEAVSDKFYDRIMLKDRATMMYPLAAEKLKMEIKNITGFRPADIGICGSALSFRNGDETGQACLTAVWARKIMAEYSENDNIVVPSASHENMNCCGCIHYFVVESDLPAPLSSKEKSILKKEKEEKEENGETNKTKTTEGKVVKPKVRAVWADDI